MSATTANIVSGQNLTFVNGVKNAGKWPATGFRVNFYLSTDSTITVADTLIGSRTIASLAAGATNEASYTVTMPRMADGTYFLGMIIDADGVIAEADETNNTYAGSQIVNTMAYPDLIGTVLTGTPVTIESGQFLTVSNMVKNRGQWQAGVSRVNLYLSTDSVITTTDTLLGYRDIAGLAAGATDSTDFTVAMPVVGSGAYYLGMIVDSLAQVAESDETNNSFAGGQITNTQLYPDLVGISLLAEPSSVSVGQNITFTTSIKNQGLVAAALKAGATSGLEARIYISPDTILDTSSTSTRNRDTWIAVADVPVTAGSEKLSVVVKPLPSLASGFYYAIMVIDLGNYVIESDETNNILVGNRIFIGTDTTPPTGSILINNGAAATDALTVSLALAASDAESGVSQMIFSTDGTNWSEPEVFAASRSLTLPGGDGTKTVSVKFRDFVGNWSPAYARSYHLRHCTADRHHLLAVILNPGQYPITDLHGQ